MTPDVSRGTSGPRVSRPGRNRAELRDHNGFCTPQLGEPLSLAMAADELHLRATSRQISGREQLMKQNLALRRQHAVIHPEHAGAIRP